MRITHRITIGSDVYASPDTSRLLRLHVRASLSEPVKYVELVLAPPNGLSLQRGDDLKLELGVDGASSRVFSGKIAQVEWKLDEVRVLAESSMARLTATRVNLAFEKQAAGDIVSALCKEAKVSTGNVEPGLKFPAYTVTSNQSAYDHARRLALQCGFDLYADPEDKVTFARPVPSGQPRVLQYGTNVLSILVEYPNKGVGEVQVFGESPASFGKGDDAAPWLTKKDVKSNAPAAGDGDVLIRAIEPAARTLQNAQQIASNLQAALQSKVCARVRLVGNPDIRLNELIQITRMPADQLNGTFKVIGVEHILNPENGFVSMLDLCE